MHQNHDDVSVKFSGASSFFLLWGCSKNYVHLAARRWYICKLMSGHQLSNDPMILFWVRARKREREKMIISLWEMILMTGCPEGVFRGGLHWDVMWPTGFHWPQSLRNSELGLPPKTITSNKMPSEALSWSHRVNWRPNFVSYAVIVS